MQFVSVVTPSEGMKPTNFLNDSLCGSAIMVDFITLEWVQQGNWCWCKCSNPTPVDFGETVEMPPLIYKGDRDGGGGEKMIG